MRSGAQDRSEGSRPGEAGVAAPGWAVRPHRGSVPLGFAVVGAILLLPRPAAAHLVTTGLGPYYDGIGHLLVTPQDMLPLLGLALLGGLAGPEAARRILFGVPAAWFLGGLVGLAWSTEITLPVVVSLTVLAVGGLLAADRKLGPGAVAGLGIGVALLHGFLNGTAMSASALGLRALAGITCTAFVLLALTAALGVAFREGWTRIAIRVAGSWMVATGLFMLGWAIR
jgi:urease accessory protein